MGVRMSPTRSSWSTHRRLWLVTASRGVMGLRRGTIRTIIFTSRSIQVTRTIMADLNTDITAAAGTHHAAPRVRVPAVDCCHSWRRLRT